MQSRLCDELGIEFPLFAFSHCRDVIAAVSNAGGFGVLGAAGHSPATLDIELSWIDDHVGGKPYGVDLLVPTSMDSKAEALTAAELEERIPVEHKAYIEHMLAEHDIDTADLWESTVREGLGDNMREVGASKILDAAFAHPVKMVVNALGVPPGFMFDRARAHGIKVGALAGARRARDQARRGRRRCHHRCRHGSRRPLRGSHRPWCCCRKLLEALQPYAGQRIPHPRRRRHRYRAARWRRAWAMGAAGVVDGLGVADHTPRRRRSLGREGEDARGEFAPNGTFAQAAPASTSRQLKSAWTDAWTAEEAPDPLPMPLQGVLAGAAFRKINQLAQSDHAGAKQLVNYYVGQGVGLMNETVSARTVVYEFMEDFANAVERLSDAVDE